MASTKRKPPNERRSEIIQTAREILISEGFHKLTLRYVAKKVGIKLASLQYHFSIRAKLIEALVKEASDYYQYKLNELLTLDLSVDPEAKITEAVRFILDDHKSLENTLFFNQLYAMAIEEQAAQDLIDGFYQQFWTMVSDALLALNTRLSREERLNRGAHIVALLEGCGFFLGSQRLRRKLPKTFYNHIEHWVIKLVLH